MGVKSSDISLWEDAGNIERGLPNGGFTAISAACLVAVRLDFFCPPARLLVCLVIINRVPVNARSVDGSIQHHALANFPLAITTASLSVPLPIDPTVRNPQTGPKADIIEYRKTTPEKNRNKDKR